MNPFGGDPARPFAQLTAQERLEKLSLEASVVIELRRASTAEGVGKIVLDAAESPEPRQPVGK